MTSATDTEVLQPPVVEHLVGDLRVGRDDRRVPGAVSEELLRVLSTALDVREIFGGVARISRRFLCHDRLVLLSYDATGRVDVRASSPHAGPNGLVDGADAGQLTSVPAFRIVEDWASDRDAGYHSVLEVHSVAGSQRFAVQFWSKRRAAFSPADFAISGRIVEHLALAIAHEQLARPRTIRRAAPESYARSVTGASRPWRGVLKQATQVAATNATVLLTGESGTGKEVVARFIHEQSRQHRDPFVALNCAAFPEHLLEAELFGYERGAFTGAVQSKPGRIEQAGNGVVFFDEIGEMTRPAQAKLLRLLQEREFQRLGGTRTQRAAARMIAATNRDLLQAVRSGEFREDLYYRLQVFEIRLPPLRERASDVPALAERFLEEIGQMAGRPPARISADAVEALTRYAWPGNVRQLRNVLERAAILCEGDVVTPAHLSLPPCDLSCTATTTVSVVERDLIRRVMRECDGNKAEAARRLGLTRKQLYVRLQRYELGR